MTVGIVIFLPQVGTSVCPFLIARLTIVSTPQRFPMLPQTCKWQMCTSFHDQGDICAMLSVPGLAKSLKS